MISRQVDASKSDSLSTFEPPCILVPGFIDREYRDKHALIEKRCFFDHISNSEPSGPFLLILHPEKEPIIVAICIQIIFNKHIVL